MTQLVLSSLLLVAIAAEEEKAPRSGDTVRITASLVEQVQARLREKVKTDGEEVEAALRKVDSNEDGRLQPKEYEDAFITIGHERFRCPEALFGFDDVEKG